MMHKIVYNFEVVFFPKDFFKVLVLFMERIRFNEKSVCFCIIQTFHIAISSYLLHLDTMKKIKIKVQKKSIFCLDDQISTYYNT